MEKSKCIHKFYDMTEKITSFRREMQAQHVNSGSTKREHSFENQIKRVNPLYRPWNQGKKHPRGCFCGRLGYVWFRFKVKENLQHCVMSSLIFWYQRNKEALALAIV